MADQLTLAMDPPVIVDDLREDDSGQLPRFGIAAEQLAQMLGIVEPAAQLPNVGPLVELSASQRGVSVRTENIMLSLTSWVPQSPSCVVAHAGSLVVGYDALSALARRVDGVLSCVATVARLDVTTPGTDVVVRRFPGDGGMPSAPTWPAPYASLTIDAAALARAIRRVVPAAAAERMSGQNAVLSGVALTVAHGSVTISACDGYRFAASTTQAIETEWKIDRAVVIPARSMSVLAGMLADVPAGTVVTVRLDERLTKLFCRSESWLWRSLLFDGTFPDIYQFLPREDPSTVVEVARTQLIAAIKLAMAFQHQTTDKRRALAVEVSEHAVTFSGADADRGRAKRSIQAQVSGQPVTLVLDGSFLTDALEVMADQDIRLHLNGPAGLAVLREQIGQDLWAIVPMVLRGVGA